MGEKTARSRDLYLTTHHTHKRQSCKTQRGFDPPVPASERQQTHALVRAAFGIGYKMFSIYIDIIVPYRPLDC